MICVLLSCFICERHAALCYNLLINNNPAHYPQKLWITLWMIYISKAETCAGVGVVTVWLKSDHFISCCFILRMLDRAASCDMCSDMFIVLELVVGNFI